MKKVLLNFVSRGLMVAAGGPIVLAIIYGILEKTSTVASLPPSEVCTAILSITLMAFIAGGITTIYNTERLPLISAILIHAGVLYLDYLIVYLLNSWLPRDLTGISMFTAIFAIGFALVWLCIYLSIRVKTRRLNQNLEHLT